MRKLSRDSVRRLDIMLFILPALIIYSFVVVFPIVQSARYSLYEDWEWIQDTEAENVEVGFNNWVRLFTEDRDPNLPEDLAINNNPFPRSILNSLMLVFLSLFVQLPVALFFALMLARGTRGEKFYRTIYFIPVILSAVVVGLIWQNIYRTDAYATGAIGLLNAVCMQLGIIDTQRQWLIDTETALVAAMIPIVWQYIGQHMLLMYAGAKSVSPSIYEAAKIDGATDNQIDWFITIPLMKPILQVSVIWAVTGSLKAFDQLYALLGQNSINDPNKTVPSLLMFREIRYFNFGASSAMAMFIVIECLVLTYIIGRIFAERRES